MKRLLLSAITLIAIWSHVCAQPRYFRMEEDFACAGCDIYTADLSTLTKYTPAQVSNIFKNMAASGITFSYPGGGCQQRAEMMHILLEDKWKISHARVWIFAPVDYDAQGSAYLEVPDPNNLKQGDIKWGYHVAPVVMQQTADGIGEAMVIDPSLDNKPLPLDAWMRKMKNYEVSKYTFLNPKWYFFNTRSGSSVINGYFYMYEPVPGTWNAYDNATMERELATNDVAAWLIGKIKADASYDDVRQLLGNATNMVSFFASQQRSNSLKPDDLLRRLYGNHPQLIQDAMAFHQSRVRFWINEVNTLKKR